MSSARRAFALELRPMLRLALPVVLGELAWIAMGVVDTMMVGALGPAAIGGVSVGRSLYLFVAIAGFGLLLGLDTLVSHAHGRGDFPDAQRSLVHGLYVAAAVSLPLSATILWLRGWLGPWGIAPGVREHAVAYLGAIAWAVLPLLAYTAVRRYLQAVSLVRPVMIAMVTANLVNALANWVLVFGKLGAPALGTAGAGWATVGSLGYMTAFLLVAAVLHARRLRFGTFRAAAGLEIERIRRIVALGLPVSVSLLLEIGVFALATMLVGRFSATWLAAHQVALLAASVTYMVPLGISSAGAVRVGQALGRDDRPGAARAGWAALALASTFMLVAALAFVLFPAGVVRLFTRDASVAAAGVVLLRIAAVFQLFDGLQVVAAGNLRGAADTRTAMLWCLVGYWALGLPIGCLLAFRAGWGATGIWTGLCLGLVAVGTILVAVWHRRTRGWQAPARAV